MEMPRSVRLARLSALIVLFILSSVSVGYVAVRMMADRDLPADNQARGAARASTHTSAATAALEHATSPFMAYGVGAASVRVDGDADDEALVLASAAAAAGQSTPTFHFVESSGGRNFTGSTHTTRSKSASGGGFSAGGGVGAGIGAHGGVSGTSPRKPATTPVKASVTKHSTSPSRPSGGHSGGGGSSGGSSNEGPAVTTTATTATSGVVALGVAPTGKLGGSGSPAPTPEPLSLVLMGAGLCGAFGARKLLS